MSGMNRPGRAWWLVLLYGFLAGPPALAELAVIHDSGRTRPLEFLTGPLLSGEPQPDEPFRAGGSTGQGPVPGRIPGEEMLARLLPVRSPGLQAGALADTALAPGVLARLAQGNPRPFFLVGSDPASLHWLAANAKTLREIGAVGLLVQADTKEDIRRVGEAAQGLSVTPGSGSDLARVLGIRHYPVLITWDGVAQ